ncbi:hypothetical protein NC651_038950 [Populus alba x Populus x berolinensis]|nr:hypothetical protein NC651_038950 [Populus alba x Populus x berolinensis]
MTTTRGGLASQLAHVYPRLQEYQAPARATLCISFPCLMALRNTIILFFSFAFLSSQNRCSVAQKWIKAGYWYGGSDFPIPDINSALFTHLICAFANVNSTTYELSIPSDFQQNFSNFTGIVKRKNPSIVTLLSIWNGQPETYKSILGEAVNSSVLSSMLTQSSYRKSFIESSVKTARTLGFQGIDLFWLWPNSTDLSKIGTLLDEWRATVDSEPRNSSVSKLILTMGVRYSPSLQSVSYPINSMKRNLDWAHVVAYDYHMPSRENFTGNHAALYNPSSNISTDFGIREWLSGGYPANKLLLGMPYHGYAWTLVDPSDSSLGAPASGPGVTIDGSIGYRFVRSFIKNYGYGARSVYNSTYVVNYFVAGSTWINFDDVETVRAKISYAKEKGLLGYNVFQVIHDDNWALSLAEGDFLSEKAYDLWENGRGMEFIDPFLDDSSSPCKLLTCMQVALLCVQENPDARPTMLEAFSMLKNDDSLAIASPERPGFSEKKERGHGNCILIVASNVFIQ